MPIDHSPIVIDQFNGLYKRGDGFSTPLDHFADCNNIKYRGSNAFQTRPGINIFQQVAVPLTNVRRIYNYITQTANTLLVLTGDGHIHHVVNATTVHTDILVVSGMTDFAFVPYAGRAYISPIATYQDSNGQNYQAGVQNEFVYVYLGDGSAARKIAGGAFTNTFTAAQSATAGAMDTGFHLYSIVLEYDTGYLSPPGPASFPSVTQDGTHAIDFTFTAFGALSHVAAIRICATKAITNYNGDQTGYEFFFLPNGRITNNAATSATLSFFDADLLDDASHLIDNFTQVNAGVGLTIYHDRLVVFTQYTDISLLRISAQGEPEAINQINGLCIFPLDGNPITNAHELRDVLYVFKRNRTGSFIDNGDVPSSWAFSYIDQALGTSIHGIATVLDSGSANIDYLVTCSFRGFELFNGRYLDPELSWKIKDLWGAFDRNNYGNIQVVNDPITKCFYMIMPDKTMLIADYGNGMTTKAIRWAPWTANCKFDTIALLGTGTLIMGSSGAVGT